MLGDGSDSRAHQAVELRYGSCGLWYFDATDAVPLAGQYPIEGDARLAGLDVLRNLESAIESEVLRADIAALTSCVKELLSIQRPR